MAVTDMDRENIVSVLKDHEHELRDRGVVALWVIGSTGRRETTAQSDIDILVDIDPHRKFSLVDHSGLRLLLCDLLNHDTDVVVAEGLRPRTRERLRRDEVRVF